jgi:hypothetical protein
LVSEFVIGICGILLKFGLYIFEVVHYIKAVAKEFIKSYYRTNNKRFGRFFAPLFISSQLRTERVEIANSNVTKFKDPLSQ